MGEQNNAYSGKYVNISKETYSLIPEVVNGGCQGCDKESLRNCYKERTNEGISLTKLCRQGYILKKVNV